jgi:hypothetical protein
VTDVGKIKLGVSIDADDLSAKLGEAVRKAIAPALAEIQKELQQVQREYDKTTRAAEESNATQAAGAREVAASLKNIRTAQLEVAAAAREAGNAEEKSSHGATRALAEQSAAIDRVAHKMVEAAAVSATLNREQERDVRKVTRAWEEQTAAIAANTAARIANASTPVGGPPGRDRVGPGRGGGYGEGGGHRGGILGFLTGPTGLNTIALGAAGIQPATAAIVGLTGAVIQLGQAGLALPGIYGGIGASIGTAALGIHGLKDAITSLNKAAGPDASAADLKKAADGMKDLSDAGKETAISVSKFTQVPLKDLQKGIQQHMFAGVSHDIDEFGSKTVPRLSTNFNRIGDSWNKTIKTVFGSVTANRNLGLIDRLLGNTAVGQNRATKAIEPFTHAIATLASTGGEFLPRLGDALAKVADRFDNFVSNAGKTGQLWKWIDEGLNGLRALGNAVLNIGKTLTGLTHAAGGDEGFLGWLERATNRMQLFVNSTEGQNKLHDFFTAGKGELHDWGDLFKALLPALGKIVEGFAAWGHVTLPIVTALAELVNWLGKVPGLVQGILVAFLAWKTIGGIIGGVGGKIGALSGVLGGSGAGPGNAKTPFGKGLNRGLLGIGLVGAGTSIQQEGGSNIGSQLLGGLATVGGSALTGATIGSIFPGPGTAVGAAVGAGVGAVIAGINVAIGQNAEEAKKAAAANDQLAASMAAEQQAYTLTAEAVKTLNDDLIASKGAFDPAAIAAVGDEISQIPDKLKGSLGDAGAKQVGDALKALNLTTDQLATIVTGAQPGFDALIARLNQMSPDGQQAAAALEKVRDGALQSADAARNAAPLLQTLADALTGGDLKQAAADLHNAFAAIPTNVPINVNAPGADAVIDILKKLNQQVTIDAAGNVTIDTKAPGAQEVIDQLDRLGIKIEQVPGTKEIQVVMDQQSVNNVLSQLGSLGDYYKSIYLPPPPAPPPPPFAVPPLPSFTGGAPSASGPHARGGVVRRFASGGWNPGIGPGSPTDPGGTNPDLWPDWWKNIQNNNDPTILYPWLFSPGWAPGVNFNHKAFGAAMGAVLPGYSPGFDNLMVPLSGGEGIVIPEAMRALGPDWLYGINSKFRPGISRAGYANGGVHGYDEGGINQPPGEDVVGLLKQIRDLLAGQGGQSSPLAATADNTRKIAATSGQGGGTGTPGLREGQTGDWGTDFINGFLAYFGIGPLGGTPLGGKRPGTPGYPGFTGGAAGGRPVFDASRYAGPLAEFARSGILTPELAGLGLDANDPIINAITSARNKKKGGLGGDSIADLVTQVLGGGGYTGALTDQNTSLIRALQTFVERGGSQVGIPGAAGRAGSPAAFGGGTFGTGPVGSADALIAFAQQSSGGKYASASDLRDGLADCSGAVSDLVELLTKGQATPARLFDTHNEAAVLTSLGAVPGLVPGSLQIGLNSGHTAATLPNGVNFESGGSGGGVVYGGPVGAGDKQFTQTFSLPTDWSGKVPAGAGAGAGMPVFGGATPGLSNFGGGVVPVYVTNWGGGAGSGAQPGAQPGGAPGAGPGGAPEAGGAPGGVPPGVAGIGQAGLTAAGGVVSGVSGDVIKAAGASIVPDIFGRPSIPTAATTPFTTLTKEGNPLALAALAGLDVPSFARAGGTSDFQKIGQGFDATGRLFSDTAAISDRTTTDTVAAIDAMRSQLVSVGNQTVNKLSDKVLTPVVQAGVTSGFSAVNSAVFAQQGTAIGTAAGPPIADAVSSAVAASSNSGGQADASSALVSGVGGLGAGLGALGGVVGGAADGGLVSGGVPGKDSVPILAQQNEWIFSTDDVAKLGGPDGVAHFVGALRSGKLRKFATGGGVGSGNQGSGPNPANVDSTVGADFFGVSQIPIIGTIINLLIDILLKVIGAQIDVRNTLNNLGEDFRGFRGDAFKAFDAQGRLISDTSALVDRSATSQQTAADERIKILKIVLDALIKFIIDKIIVPLLEAVGQAAVSALSSAVSSGISGASFGAGGAGGAAASSFINSLGDASIQIAGSIGTDVANAATDAILQQLATALPSLLPGLTTSLFGGGFLQVILGPIGTLLQLLLGGFLGALTVLLGGTLGGLGTVIPGDALFGGIGGGGGGGLGGLLFDEGGMASGVGYLPKGTMGDELVLSPKNTDIFSRFVGALEGGGYRGGTTIHAPIKVIQAGPETPAQVQDRLLRYMP